MKTNETEDDIHADIMRLFDRAIVQAREDDVERGGLTPYQASLTPEQLKAHFLEIRQALNFRVCDCEEDL